MTKLKFNDFEFSHNPKKLQIEWNKNLRVFRPPGNAVIVQNLGIGYRIIKGNGEFFGKDAFVQFLRLSDTFRQTGKGILTLPGMDSFYAEFRSLKLIGEAGDNLITYEFEFWEIPREEAATDKKEGTYKVNSGDNLWIVSASTGISVEMLMRLNPSIKNPFDLTAGMEVIVS